MDTAVHPYVLVVEDDGTTAAMLRRYLELEGYRVEVAADGRGALDAAYRSTPAVIVLDYGLPEINGAEFVEALEQAGVREQVRIILVTGVPDALELAHHMRVDRWFDKPVDIEQVSSAVRELLYGRLAEQLVPRELDMEDLLLEEDARKQPED